MAVACSKVCGWVHLERAAYGLYLSSQALTSEKTIGRDGQGGGAMENGRVLPGEGMFVLRYRELRHADGAAKTENCQGDNKTAQIGSIHALHSI